MVVIQPVRHLILELAGKILRGESLSERERGMLDSFRQAFPDVKNPVFVYCAKDGHRTFGVLLYDPSEPLDPNLIGIARGSAGQWVCTDCKNGDNIRIETVRLI